MKLERRHEPLLPRKAFLTRELRYAGGALLIVSLSLSIGILGYHEFGHLDWVDSLLNASFILTGMGPVDQLHTVGGKLFASAYAVFSGIAFLSTIGILMTPLAHRFLHRFHLEEGRNRS
jgi:hypothetical protein